MTKDSVIIEKISPHVRWVAYVLALCGMIGFVAAFILTTERITLLQDTNYIPPCDINPLISCGSVMKTAQASAFGFPNSLLGIGGFAIIATVGMAIVAGATFRRWFWFGLEAGLLFAVAFVHWLIFQSLFVIEALCPYCMVVWIVTIASFFWVTVYNLATYATIAQKSPKVLMRYFLRHSSLILVAWYLVILFLILQRFWDQWQIVFSSLVR